ncbi:MAG: hypothetical protein ABR499_21265 [Gemmatimonadaceae bacterium]
MRRAQSALVGVALALAAACESNPIRPDAASPRGTPEPRFAALPVSQTAADEISLNVLKYHFPLRIIVDAMFATSDTANHTVVGYIHAGDAAIWTGHFLAAEAFRYASTGNQAALDNVKAALDGINRLSVVTSTGPAGQTQPGLLARFYMPQDWEHKDSVFARERADAFYEGVLDGKPHWWMAFTSRDQYSGVFFGLGVAYSLIPKTETGIHSQASAIATRLLDYLLKSGWNVVNPNGTTSTTFSGRYDQQLSFLQVGRRLNPTKFDATYKSYRTKYASWVATPIRLECSDPHGSYYKFNLNHINLFNLVRLEETTSSYRKTYLNAFNDLRNCTGSHQNAHFNMIDRGLRGANSTQDAATREYLRLWLERPQRDYYVDLRGKYEACGENRACSPIPINERLNTDFLWQRSPFLLYGGGDGRTETAALDYLLPYWMGRYYGVITQ